jgi:hypothetical protein
VTRLLFNNRPANRVEKLALPVDAEPAAEVAAKPEDKPANVAVFTAAQAAK